MIKYGLLVCLMLSVAGISAMDIREDLQGLSYQELQELEQVNYAAEKAFNEKYTSGEWRRDANVKKERDAIFEQAGALAWAIMMSGLTPNDLIKPHCITIDQSDKTSSSNDVEELPSSLKKYCRTFTQIEEQDDQCRREEDVEQSKKAKNGSTKENLKARIQALRDEQDSLFKNLTNHSNNERIAERSDEIENELSNLNKQLKACSLQWSVK